MKGEDIDEKIEYEKCVVCHQETEVKKDEPIQNRTVLCNWCRSIMSKVF